MSDAPETGTTIDRVTTARGEIERWIRGRGGHPVEIPSGAAGLGFRFPGEDGEGDSIDWDAFFERFEEEELAFAYDSEASDAAPGDACTLIDRDRTTEAATEPPAGADEADTPERVGDADSAREADQRDTVRTTDARDQENVDNHRDEPPFQS